MARGFGGETTAQEARGNEGLSSSDIAGGRQDAATSAAIGGRDVDPGAGGGDNYTANDYIPNMARVNEVLDYRQKQEAFNLANGITDANPFGRLSRGVMGFAINKLGLDPKHVSYPSLSLSQRRAIANNQFSKFMNPQNKPGEIVNNRASDLFTGFNPNFRTAKAGELRYSVQYDGYKTQYGDVMSQAREQSTGEMLARGVMGLAGGPIGMALAQLGTKEYGLPGVDGFDSFDPNNPRPGGGILGQFLGGLNPTQAKEALVGAFAPSVPAPTPTSIGTAPADLKGFENRFSQHPLTGEKTVSTPVDSTLQPGFSRTTTQTLPDGRTITVDKETGAVLGTNLFGGQQSSLQNTVAGEQLAGSFFDSMFRDPMISPEAREILKEKGMTIDDLFAPKTPTPEPEKPKIMDLIQGATQTSALGGPSTANQYAQVDYSNLSNVGGNLYQPVRETSTLDTVLEALGMKAGRSGPSGQIILLLLLV